MRPVAQCGIKEEWQVCRGKRVQPRGKAKHTWMSGNRPELNLLSEGIAVTFDR